MGFGDIENQYDALIQAWYGGQAAGLAVADVLFGNYNPAGRLPVTFYKSTDQLPDFENYDMEGRTYRYFRENPCMPSGTDFLTPHSNMAMQNFPGKASRQARVSKLPFPLPTQVNMTEMK